MDNKTRQMTISQQNDQEVYSPLTERERIKYLLATLILDES